MTIRHTLQFIRTTYPTIAATWIADVREYRIAYKLETYGGRTGRDRQEAQAYYSNDSTDAIATAKFMHSAFGQ